MLLPAHDRHLLLQPMSFLSSFSSRNLKSLEGAVERNREAPNLKSFFVLRIYN